MKVCPFLPFSYGLAWEIDGKWRDLWKNLGKPPCKVVPVVKLLAKFLGIHHEHRSLLSVSFGCVTLDVSCEATGLVFRRLVFFFKGMTFTQIMKQWIYRVFYHPCIKISTHNDDVDSFIIVSS